MKLGVVDLGYVGEVPEGYLSRQHHEVIDADPDIRKVDLIDAGKTTACIAAFRHLQPRSGNFTAVTTAAGSVVPANAVSSTPL